ANRAEQARIAAHLGISLKWLRRRYLVREEEGEGIACRVGSARFSTASVAASTPCARHSAAVTRFGPSCCRAAVPGRPRRNAVRASAVAPSYRWKKSASCSPRHSGERKPLPLRDGGQYSPYAGSSSNPLGEVKVSENPETARSASNVGLFPRTPKSADPSA